MTAFERQVWLGCSSPASWAMSQGAVYVSTDGGAHCQKSDTVPGAPAIDLLKLVSAKHAFAGMSIAYPLAQSLDDGQTWQTVNFDSGILDNADMFNVTRVVFADESHGWAVLQSFNGRNWLLHTADGGTTWQPIALK